MAAGYFLSIIQSSVETSIGRAIKTTKDQAVSSAIKVRKDIIRDWFGSFNGEELLTDECNKGFSNTKNKRLKGVLSVTTYTDSDGFSNKESAERWRKKHGGSIPSNEFVLGLMFNEGYIGLPPYSTKTPHYNGAGWLNGVNLQFHGKTPLNSALSNDRSWEQYMNEIETIIYNNLE